MNANELQIGDKLNLSDEQGEVIPCEVVELHTDELLVIQPGDKACDIVGYDMINPIPFTTEIAEKNGFDSETFLTAEWGKEVYFKEFPGCVVEPDDSGEYIFGTTIYWEEKGVDGSPLDWGTMYESRIKGLHFVHELQHALRLCGLNDLANNIKI